MNSQRQKILNLLTICRKSGNLVIGFDAVKNTFSENSVFCVLAAEDISENTLKKITAVCDSFSKRNVPLIKTNICVDELEMYLGRKTAVAAVCSEGFAKRFIKLSENTQPEQK